jgi:hypothetical protein
LKSGLYYNVKPWITGGPYAAVYIYGVKGATRNRKKVYVHRLVAQHFVGGRKSGNVVHHKSGPGNNTKTQLEWVTPSQNNNARRYFTDDGKRRTKVVRVKKKPKVSVPAPKVPGKTHVEAVKKAKQPKAPAYKPAPPKPKPIKAPAPDDKKHDGDPDEKDEKAPPQSHGGAVLPSDPDEYYGAETFFHKLKWLYKRWPPFKKLWKVFRKNNRDVDQKNFQAKFKEATGKNVKMGNSPATWFTVLVSAMNQLEVSIKR